MPQAEAYSPEALRRMSTVYRSAFQELRLQLASRAEQERLARCILALGNSHTDPHRLHAKAVQNYQRGRLLNARRQEQVGKSS
jgi:hypothetical protein